MLRKCKTVIATIVVTVMMFSVFSYAGSTGNGTQERIMEEARKLLAYTNLSSAEIADILHFSTATYFNRFFTRNGGMTPQKFRESVSNPEN